MNVQLNVFAQRNVNALSTPVNVLHVLLTWLLRCMIMVVPVEGTVNVGMQIPLNMTSN